MKSATFLLFFSTMVAWSQEKIDSSNIFIKQQVVIFDSARNKVKAASINLISPKDSIVDEKILKLDSIRFAFKSNVDSLQLSYRKPINKMDSVGRKLQHKIDSLNSLRLPTIRVTAKLDSVTRARTAKISEMNQKVDHLKQKANKGLSEVQLPPQMQGPVNDLSKSINGYNIPMVNGKIPGINTSSSIPGLQLPNGKLTSPGTGNLPGMANTNTQGIGQLGGITAQTNGLSKITGQAGAYGDDVKKITEGNIAEVRNVDKAAENALMKNESVGVLKGKNAEMDKYKQQLNGRPDSMAMSMAKQEVMKEATDHFKGQEVLLKESMGKMSKLKARYREVKSVAELPKKLPNPLHDTPFIERIIPGVTFQVNGSNPFSLDVNIGALYRISPRFSAGGGWVQRLIFDHKKRDERAFGPRAAFQFNLSNGFSLRALPEVINLLVPSQFSSGSPDNRSRQWEWSLLVGMKKDFKVYKKIRGNTEALYNFHSPQATSPYPDQFVVRFGFEFPMKRNEIRK